MDFALAAKLPALAWLGVLAFAVIPWRFPRLGMLTGALTTAAGIALGHASAAGLTPPDALAYRLTRGGGGILVLLGGAWLLAACLGTLTTGVSERRIPASTRRAT